MDVENGPLYRPILGTSLEENGAQVECGLDEPYEDVTDADTRSSGNNSGIGSGSQEDDEELNLLIKAYLHDVHYTTLSQAVFNIIYSIINAGIVVLPFIARAAGVPLFVCVVTLISIVSGYSSVMVISLANEQRVRTLEDLADRAFGSRGFYTVCAFQILFSGCLMAITLDIWAQIMSSVFSHYTSGHQNDGDGALKPLLAFLSTQIGQVALGATLTLPLCVSKRSMSSMRWMSYLTVVAMAVALLSVIVAYVTTEIGIGDEQQIDSNSNSATASIPYSDALNEVFTGSADASEQAVKGRRALSDVPSGGDTQAEGGNADASAQDGDSFHSVAQFFAVMSRPRQQWWAVFFVMAFCFSYNQKVFTVYSSLRRRTTRRWEMCVFRANSIASLLYVIFGVFGYLVIQRTNIEMSAGVNYFVEGFNQNQYLFDISRSLVAACLLLTTPVDCLVAATTWRRMRSRFLRARHKHRLLALEEAYQAEHCLHEQHHQNHQQQHHQLHQHSHQQESHGARSVGGSSSVNGSGKGSSKCSSRRRKKTNKRRKQSDPASSASPRANGAGRENAGDGNGRVRAADRGSDRRIRSGCTSTETGETGYTYTAPARLQDDVDADTKDLRACACADATVGEQTRRQGGAGVVRDLEKVGEKLRGASCGDRRQSERSSTDESLPWPILSESGPSSRAYSSSESHGGSLGQQDDADDEDDDNKDAYDHTHDGVLKIQNDNNVVALDGTKGHSIGKSKQIADWDFDLMPPATPPPAVPAPALDAAGIQSSARTPSMTRTPSSGSSNPLSRGHSGRWSAERRSASRNSESTDVSARGSSAAAAAASAGGKAAATVGTDQRAKAAVADTGFDYSDAFIRSEGLPITGAGKADAKSGMGASSGMARAPDGAHDKTLHACAVASAVHVVALPIAEARAEMEVRAEVRLERGVGYESTAAARSTMNTGDRESTKAGGDDAGRAGPGAGVAGMTGMAIERYQHEYADGFDDDYGAVYGAEQTGGCHSHNIDCESASDSGDDSDYHDEDEEGDGEGEKRGEEGVQDLSFEVAASEAEAAAEAGILGALVFAGSRDSLLPVNAPYSQQMHGQGGGGLDASYNAYSFSEYHIFSYSYSNNGTESGTGTGAGSGTGTDSGGRIAGSGSASTAGRMGTRATGFSGDDRPNGTAYVSAASVGALLERDVQSNRLCARSLSDLLPVLVVWAVCTGITLVFNNAFMYVFSMIGTISTSALVFILPSMLYFKLGLSTDFSAKPIPLPLPMICAKMCGGAAGVSVSSSASSSMGAFVLPNRLFMTFVQALGVMLLLGSLWEIAYYSLA